jgi:phosphoserine phosphatase
VAKLSVQSRFSRKGDRTEGLLNMALPQNIIAVIFDFDDTLTDDSTTLLLDSKGIDTKEFWQVKLPAKMADGWDPTLAYLSMLLELVGDGKPLGALTNQDLQVFGATLQFYQGLPGLFADLQAVADEYPMVRPMVEIFIISGGLEEVILGSSIAKHVNKVYGCRFATDGNGVISHVKNVISFTEKTRFIFEINKGLGADGSDARTNPYEVNSDLALANRRVPLENMIYVGDGLTDVPCFSLLKKSGGYGFGVVDPKKKGKPKKAFETLVAPARVMGAYEPKYGEGDLLGEYLRNAVSAISQKILMRGSQAV